MAGFNSDILDPIDDFIEKIEKRKMTLTIKNLNRLLKIVERLMAIAEYESIHGLSIYKSKLECNQACCNIVFIIRINALILDKQGLNSDRYVLSCFKKTVKDEILREYIS